MDERFLNGAGEGHFFPFAYEAGVLKAYALNRNEGEEFTPELTDMVIARADKSVKDGAPDLSNFDGVEAVENFIRDTTVVNTRLFEMSAALGEANASIVELTTALADETIARVTDVAILTADVGDNTATTTLIMEALSSPDGSTSLIAFETDADGVTTGIKIISVATGSTTPISAIELTAAQVRIHGDTIFEGSITAGLLDPGSIAAIGYVFPTTGGITTSYATKASKAVTTDGGPVEIEFAALLKLAPRYSDCRPGR